MSTSRTTGPEKSPALVSWKEIAVFLGRAERTVKRWERQRGMPIHRIPGGERGSVFAYPDELRAWLLGELGLAAPDSRPIHDRRRRVSDRRQSPKPVPLPADDTAPAETATLEASSAIHHPIFEWAAAAAAIFTLAAGSVFIVGHSSMLASALERITVSDSKMSAHVPKPKAESLYLQGRYQWGLRTADSLDRALDAYTQAIVLDPQYAQAYAGLAETYELLPEYAHADQGDSYARAKLAAAKAIEIDPNLAAGHRAMAFALFWGDWNISLSDAEFRRALALAPNEQETHHWYSTTLLSRQEYTAAIAQADQALRLGPTNPAVAADVAWVHASLQGNRQAAIETLRDLARTQPSLVKPARYLARLEFEDENYPAFLGDLQTAASISQDPDELALAQAASRGWAGGGKPGLLEALRQAHKAAFDSGHTSGFALARTYLLLGKPDVALPYFQAAFDRNDFNLMTLRACDCIATLREDPGYAQLLRRIHQRMHLPPGALTNRAPAFQFN